MGEKVGELSEKEANKLARDSGESLRYWSDKNDGNSPKEVVVGSEQKERKSQEEKEAA